MSLILSIARLSLRFGQVRRVTRHPDGEFESDTTHTFMLCLLVMELAPHFGLDVGLAVQLAMVHDLPEVHSGDTNTAGGLSAEQAAAKAQREAEAVVRLSHELAGSRLVDLIHRYERQVDPEARFVRYLDKVLPKLTHFINGGLALRTLGMSAEEVRENHERQGASLAAQYPELDGAKALFEAACDLVERAVQDGSIVLPSRTLVAEAER